jgi:hypothetical protein
MDFKPATKDMVDQVARMQELYHPELNGLTIAVIMQEEASKSRGKTILAFACKPTERMRPLLRNRTTSFIICLAKDAWEKATAGQRAAIVDHELCHCGFDGQLLTE